MKDTVKRFGSKTLRGPHESTKICEARTNHLDPDVNLRKLIALRIMDTKMITPGMSCYVQMDSPPWPSSISRRRFESYVY